MLDKKGKDYHLVAIIGVQSSGKSTLLNLLFGTNFKVMNDEDEQQQTTLGIWVNTDKHGKFVVLDIEGTDSDERGEQSHNVEKSCSLFGLAFANSLMINMNASAIGTKKGSSIELLKLIMEANLKILGQVERKKLIFIIRDFDQSESAKPKTEVKIMNRVSECWQSLVKGNTEMENKEFEDFFDVTTLFFPHKKHLEKEFTEKC